ncbi:MAG: DNA-protecting protein DprA [Provencibacterium sp.]|nr:DNA-protecting protein DprA [Provencibacterium sp.]
MAGYDRKIYWIWLQQVFSPGSHRINALFGKFSTAQAIYELGREGWIDSHAFTERELERLAAASIEKAQAVFLRAQELNCQVITPEDPLYPVRLRHIYAMPAVLYVKGDISQVDQELIISMVGTRSCTEYGLRAAETLAGQLAKRGAVIVSGLAAGIDTAAIQGALHASGKAYAVTGCGIDIAYPAQNRKLMEWMCQYTAVITEYPPATPPYPGHFPQRNRLISGLGLGTVVVEAGEGSGALITAGHALEQGKDVFGVTARMEDSRSSGVFNLIRAGAKPVFSAEDVLEEYRHLFSERAEKETVNPTAGTPAPQEKPEPGRTKEAPEWLDETGRVIFEALEARPASVQAIAARTGLGVGELLPALTELEIEGIVCSGPIGQFRLAEEYLLEEATTNKL